MYQRLLFILILVVSFLLLPKAYADNLPLEQIQMPPRFHISVFADGIKNARELALGDNGIVFVGSSAAAKVYAIVPVPNHPIQHQIKIIASGLNQPQGVAFYKGDLYVAEVDRIIRYNHIENLLDNPPPPQLVTNQFPIAAPEGDSFYQRHGWKTIHFGPDNKLYVAVGAPCDSCLSKDLRDGTIMRMNPDGSDMEVYAKGVRNSVGFDWQPITQKLWFTDNGVDTLGDNFPPDKLNYAPVKGLDFGFPYYCGKDENGQPIPDPKFGKLRSPDGITWEAINLPAHVAVLGMVFYTGSMLPAQYHNQIIVAEHGSRVRSTKIGYRLALIKINGDKALSYTPFITGWEKNEKFWGRPVALLVMPDGSLLVSDDYAGVIYRVTYRNS